MNDIKIVTLLKLTSVYSIMAEGIGCVVDKENGSLQDHSSLTVKASQEAMSARKPLCGK